MLSKCCFRASCRKRIRGIFPQHALGVVWETANAMDGWHQPNVILPVMRRKKPTWKQRNKKYFSTHPEPEYGDRVAARFRAEYAKMRNQGDSSDAIYEQLLRLILPGLVMHSLKKHVSAYVVLAFLFEQCEIFERPAISCPQ